MACCPKKLGSVALVGVHFQMLGQLVVTASETLTGTKKIPHFYTYLVQHQRQRGLGANGMSNIYSYEEYHCSGFVRSFYYVPGVELPKRPVEPKVDGANNTGKCISTIWTGNLRRCIRTYRGLQKD